MLISCTEICHAQAESVTTWHATAKQGQDNDMVHALSFDFDLILVRKGNLICGEYSDNLFPDKTDFSMLYGRANGNEAKLYFINGFTGELPSFGIVNFKFDKHKGYWGVEKFPEGFSYIWGDTTLNRANNTFFKREKILDFCNKRWDKISNAKFDTDNNIIHFLEDVGRF